MIKYKDVKDITTEEYFNGNQFSVDAFNKKYNQGNETYPKALKRVCDYIASCEETEELREYWSERWFDEIYNDWWHPAGSIMQGAASNKNISLSNCTTISLGKDSNESWDNLESIIKNTAYTVAKTAAYRQGLGVDFSAIRPRGLNVENSSNESQGAIHWMKLIDSLGFYIGQKGRIPAMLFSISVNHPDVEEFINVKSDYTVIQNANISVQTNDAFYEAVKNDDDWTLSFTIPALKKGEKVYLDVHSIDKDTLKDDKGYYNLAPRDREEEVLSKTVKARKLLELIAKNMTANAEPGIQQIDKAKYWSNSDYVYDPNDEYDSRILSTNAPLVGSTLVPTKNGLIPIKDLYSQDKVQVLSDTFVTFPDNIRKTSHSSKYRTNVASTTFHIDASFKKFENQEVWEIELSDGRTFSCNGEHEWFVDGSFKKTKDLQPNDKINKANGGIYQAFDYNTDFNSSSFKDGQLIGYFVGDGWIGTPSDHHNKMIGIMYSEDSEYYNQLFRSKYSELNNGNTLNFVRNRGKINEVRTENNNLVNYFESFGFKNDKYHIPERCFTDFDFCAGFINGLLNADGNIQVKNYCKITLTSVSKDMLSKLQNLLSDVFGIHSFINKRKTAKPVQYCLSDGTIKYSDVKDCYNLIIGNKIGTFRLNKFIGCHGKKGDLLKSVIKPTHNNSNKLVSKVKSVIKTDRYEDMYCAVVPYFRSFVVNGCISSNCSEQYLSRESLCVLASINAGAFSIDPKQYDSELKKIAYSVNRFLDNVNEMEVRNNTYATPHQKMAIQKLRRTGAGITNMAAWLFKANFEYASEDGNDKLCEFNRVYNYYLYESSISIGKEKGSFGLFNREKFEKSPFIQHMMSQGLVFEAMRNVTCSSIAPTGCIEENTRIVTDNGLVKIKDIIETKPNTKSFEYNLPNISAFDENGKNKVTAYYNNGIVNGYVIEFEDGREIKVSETHRIRILKNGKYDWEYAPKLRTNDIAVLSKNTSSGVENYVSLDTSLNSNHHNCSEFKCPSVLNEKLAELVGMFTGDGSIKFRSESDRVDGIRFPIYSEDSDLISYLNNSFNEMFSLKTNTLKRENSNMYEMSIHSINLGNYFINNKFEKKSSISKGCHTKDHVYSVPELIFKSPKSVICSYLRGLFEADGSISNDGAISLSSKHESVIKDVQELLTYVGIQSIIDIKNRSYNSFSENPIFNLRIRFKHDKQKFANDIGFLSSRKNDRLSNIDLNIDREKVYFNIQTIKNIQKSISNKFGSKCKLYSKLTTAISNNKCDNVVYINRDLLNEIVSDVGMFDSDFDLNNYFNLKIKSIKRAEFQTYDIEVNDKNHSYVTSNGVINHNTLSLMFRDFIMSYGVEPAFGIYFWKRTRISGKYEYYFCVPNVVRKVFKEAGYEIPIDSDCVKDTWDGSVGKPIAEFIDENSDKIGIKFKNATEVNVLDKLDLMSKLMKNVDSSISVTYTLDEKSSWKDVYDLIIAANDKGVKSIAAFPDRKMYGIVSFICFKDLAFKLKKENVEIHTSNFTDEELSELNLVVENKNTSIHAPKRQKSLSADLFQVTVRKKKYLMAIGIQDGSPYEMFGGVLKDDISIKFPKKGNIVKVGKGRYKLEIDNQIIEDFGSLFTDEEQIIFRMISTSLRHGIPIKFIVDQLGKSAEDVVDLASATSRVLKKYIASGDSAGGSCPSCGAKTLVYIDGCVSCASCGWSKGCG